MFIDKSSNPAAVQATGAGAVLDVRPDCVYWVNRRQVPMVCDVATGTSQPFVTPNGVASGNCWFFDDNSMGNNHGDDLEKLVIALDDCVFAKDNWLRIGVGED